jgi:hypothetical protein
MKTLCHSRRVELAAKVYVRILRCKSFYYWTDSCSAFADTVAEQVATSLAGVKCDAGTPYITFEGATGLNVSTSDPTGAARKTACQTRHDTRHDTALTVTHVQCSLACLNVSLPATKCPKQTSPREPLVCTSHIGKTPQPVQVKITHSL